MLERGDIVVERLTSNRAMVIQIGEGDTITCRFGDGRLEDRYAFELEPAPSLMGSLMSLLVTPFLTHPRENRPPAVSGRVRPLFLRQPGSS